LGIILSNNIANPLQCDLEITTTVKIVWVTHTLTFPTFPISLDVTAKHSTAKSTGIQLKAVQSQTIHTLSMSFKELSLSFSTNQTLVLIPCTNLNKSVFHALSALFSI